ncbi:MAG TPA: Ig-like domain-containing protein [Dongiaceae bacterium]|nr:Ig-like domain-containing protein [Dongiaceae bacterium]
MANQIPTVTGTFSGSTYEDSGVPASGTVIVTDPDPGQSFTKVASGSTKFGSWTVDANGNWAYYVNNANATIQALGAGVTRVETFNVTSLDGSVTKTISVTIIGTNDVPTITGTSTGNVVEDGTLKATGTLTVKDVDQGQSLAQVVTNASAAHGTWSVTNKGVWTYNLNNADPAVQALPAGQTMTDNFTVTSLDGTKTQVVTITITGTNDVPTITGTTTGGVLSHGTLTTSGTLTVTDVDTGESHTKIVSNQASTYGSWSVDSDGHWSYQVNSGNATVQALAPGATLTDTFTVTSLDGTATKVVSITITGTDGNHPPTTTGQSVSGNEDTPIPGQLTASDVDGDTLTYALALNGAPAHGNVTINADGSYSYTPAANYNGQDSFTYQVSDGHGGTATATVSLTINPVDDAPVAPNASFATAEDTSLTGAVVATDIDSPSLTYALVGTAPAGLVFNADGTFSYNPPANFSGQVSFSYKANDGSLDSNQATATIDVAAVNHPPTTTGQSVSGNEDTPIPGQLTASDVDGDTLSYVLALNGGPAHGTVTINSDGSYSYTPAADYNGQDSFTYQVSDGHGGTATAAVSLTVNPVDDAPVAQNASFATAEDTSLTGAVVATDIDSPSLTYALVGTAPAGLVFNADGTFSYNPPANFSGQVSFSFKANDGSLDSNAATATIDVAAVNHPPTTTGQSVAGNEDTPIPGQLTASDVDGDTLSYALAQNGAPAHGSVTINPDGSYSYTPAANYNGSDSFTYQVSDGHGGTATAVVSLTVNPVDDAPVAQNASFATAEDTSLTGAVVATDIDSATLTYALVGNAPAGLVFNADGTFSYNPPTNFNGQVSFSYKANDGSLDSAPATVTINVTPVNDAPVAQSASFATAEDTKLSGAVVATDIDSLTLTYALVGSAPTGLVFNTDGTFSYAPPADFNGQVSFSFKANDGSLDSAPATAIINITPVNDPPTTTGQSVSGNENTPITGQLTGSDVDGDTLTYALAANGGPTHGTVTVNQDGSYSYAPAANYFGADNFTYQVNDGHGGTATASVALAVNPVYDLNFSPLVVQMIDTTAWPNPSPDPAGIAWIPGKTPGTGMLLMSDSEIDETPFFRPDNLFVLSPTGVFDHSVSLEGFTKEPTGLAYDPLNGHLYISDDVVNKVFEVDPYNPTTLISSFSTLAFGDNDAEGIGFDPVTGHLLVLAGDQSIQHPQTIWEVTTTGTVVSSIALPAAIGDDEAIVYDPTRNVFYMGGETSADIFVVSRDGQILDTITLLEGYGRPDARRVLAKDLTLAPSSDPNDAPGTMSLWVADYGADQFMDGRLFELQLAPTSILPSLFSANNDVVDFSTVHAGTYLYGSEYNALGGNDTVTLPVDTAAAAASGYDPSQPFHGWDGNDVITGGNLNDTIYGDNGDDKLVGGAGNDTLYGGAGKDTLVGGAGNDLLNGGSGTDTVDYSTASHGVAVDLGLGTATGDGSDTLVGIENVTGSGFDDTITGNTGSNVLLGGAGNDILHGGDGNDTLTGGTGLDQLFGDAGTDTLKWDSADKLDGGTGFDTVDANLSSTDTIDLRGPNIVNVERILTGGGNDTVTLSLNDVLSDTADHQFVASLGTGTDTLNIDLVGGWTATTSNPTLGPTGVAAGISVAGMTAYTFTNGTDAATVFSDAEVLHAQTLTS